MDEQLSRMIDALEEDKRTGARSVSYWAVFQFQQEAFLSRVCRLPPPSSALVSLYHFERVLLEACGIERPQHGSAPVVGRASPHT